MEAWKKRTRKALLTCALCLCLWPSASAAIWPFSRKRFTKNALISAGSLGFNEDGRVAAFGDFNADQSLDVVFLSPDQRTISIYLWDHDNFEFSKSFSFSHPSTVYNVVPGDFTYDGKLDLLVMSQGNNNQIGMSVYLGPFSSSAMPRKLDIPAATGSQPIPVDANGDMKIDLLGMYQSSSGQPSIKLWNNTWSPSDQEPVLFQITDPILSGTTCQLANPHSNAVVDLDGDCLADLFLVCTNPSTNENSYQIWTNKKDQGFALSRSGSLPSGIGAITFADIDRDGTIDMIFPTCSSVSSSSGVGYNCAINIAYNTQRPLCTSTSTESDSTCRSPEELCTADPNFAYDFGSKDAFVSISISDLSSSSSASLLVQDNTYNPPLPVPIRVGDANLDGFPDMIPIIASGSSRTPTLLLSVDCNKGIAGCDANGRGRRGFQIVDEDVESLSSISDARSVSWLDLDEDGTLDIMVQRTGPTKVTFIQNNFFFDAFFLKAIVLNGACNGWCEGQNGSQKYHPFGVSYSGASYKYTVLDTAGSRSAAQVGQMPQTSYHSLQTPYSFFGLGRTNNYIENLFVGSTKHVPEHFINIEGVIPNSKVVIIPPEGDSTDWKKELFLRPGDWIPWVGLTVVTSMILLALMVLVLHLNEKREDELERRRASHHINFDAL